MSSVVFAPPLSHYPFSRMFDRQLSTYLGLGFISYGLYRVLAIVFRPYFSPWRNIPGPPRASFIRGNTAELLNTNNDGNLLERWVEEYGTTICWSFFLNERRLMTLDTKANAHFINRTDIYQRPPPVRSFFLNFFGQGILAAEGDIHKRQRRAMNPAFGQAQVNELTGIFLAKANELADKLDSQLASYSSPKEPVSSPAQQPAVDLFSLLSKATLDVIGLAGFLYSFDSLSSTAEAPNEFIRAFKTLVDLTEKPNIWGIITFMIPAFRNLPVEQERKLRHSRDVMKKIGSQLVLEKKAHVSASIASNEIGKGSIQDRDLISLLVRSNMANDLDDSQRLSDEEVIGQIPTFLAAGHDTTSAALSWALHALSQHPEMQERLRNELQTVVLSSTDSTEPIDGPVLNALNALPYLDAVVRETLRLYSPVPLVGRTAVRDDVVSLEKPFVDRNGVLHDTLVIPKGHSVMIPIIPLHHAVSIWGPDAKTFNPDRWLGSGPGPQAASIPGVYSNLLTFYGGSHACIGWRFSVLETKVFLHALITRFHFKPAADILYQFARVVVRPQVRDELEKGYQLPLLLSRVEGN